jgi:DNA-binding XRE family transcriptional regulator
MAVTEQQVRIFMAKRAAGQSQATAAAQAGLSERTGRRLEKGPRVGGIAAAALADA